MLSEIETIRTEAAKGLDRAEREKAELLAATKTKDEEIRYFSKILKDIPKSQLGRNSNPASPKPKNSADKEAVVKATIEVLTENRPQAIPLEDLKSLVQERLKKKGFSLVGTFRFFEKYLQEADAISETKEGFYGLAGGEVSKVA